MGFRIRTLAPGDPPESFPDPAHAGIALGYPAGLLAVGGDLSPARLLAAYRRGIFPWYNDDQPILWWSPDPRAVIYTQRFHMARSLARELRRGGWEYSLNQRFAAVIDGCATNRGAHGTWITPAMREAYLQMHELGYAHSIESWYRGELAGGIYGLRLGRVFFGESMFSAISGGSKVAISALASICRVEGIRLIDCQVDSDHLWSLGMELVPRTVFLEQLEQLAASGQALPGWTAHRHDASPLENLRHSA